jgi:hypothetical protein
LENLVQEEDMSNAEDGIPTAEHLADLYVRAQKRGHTDVATSITRAAEISAKARSLAEEARRLAAFVEPA